MDLMLLQTDNESIVSKKYMYLLPHPLLRDSIAHYTYMQDRMFDQEKDLTLVPDAAGCIVIQATKDAFSCMFWGGTTRCVNVRADGEHIIFRFFVEFLPTGAFTFLHHDQKIYQNEQVELSKVHQMMANEIYQSFEKSSSIQDFVVHLDALFLHLRKAKDASVVFIQKHINAGNTIQQIEHQVGYSRRHIQRMFQEQMGCSMKQYQKVERINRSVQLLQKNRYTIAQIAQLCGYFDEAHYIHDFQNVMAVTPRQYAKSLSTFYNENFKF